MKTKLLNFSIDRENKKISVEREFAAPISIVWAAWTDSQILDQWWAPKPWKSRTKTMDFREGGYWLYAMIGPDGTENWARADFKSIIPLKQFSVYDSFCDKDGNIDYGFPSANWTNKFTGTHDSTIVNIDIQYKELSDLEKYIEMGFKEGFLAGMENLDEWLESQ